MGGDYEKYEKMGNSHAWQAGKKKLAGPISAAVRTMAKMLVDNKGVTKGVQEASLGLCVAEKKQDAENGSVRNTG
jgi:hypothetical protein